MNCRRFVVIAVVFCGLVPAEQTVSAETPTRQVATATATILTPVSTHDIIRQTDPVKNRDSYSGRGILIKFVDNNGFVAPAASPHHRKIIIIDLP